MGRHLLKESLILKSKSFQTTLLEAPQAAKFLRSAPGQNCYIVGPGVKTVEELWSIFDVTLVPSVCFVFIRHSL
jgi:hypothetical protein